MRMDHVDGYPIEVRPVIDPQGRTGVLLQMPDGFVIMRPAGAREVGLMLLGAADEADR